MRLLGILLISLMASGVGAQPAGELPTGTELLVRHLRITGPSTGIELSGQLTMPSHPQGRLPAIVLVTGQGPHTREQTISGCPTFRMIADYLASRGIAVLSTDPRGFGYSSGPDELSTTAADRALDTQLWLKELRKQPEVDLNRIGVVGHSEGAMVALLVGADTDLANFLVLMGCPGEGGGDIWIEQKVSSLATRGASPTTQQAVRTAFEKFVSLAAKGFESDDAYYAAGKEVLKAHGVEEAQQTNQFVDKILSDLRSPNMRFLLSFDPASILPRVNEPILAIWGEQDEQVPPSRNAPLFELARDGRAKIIIARLRDLDHFMLSGEKWKPGAKHDYGRMTVSAELLKLLDDYVKSGTTHQHPNNR